MRNLEQKNPSHFYMKVTRTQKLCDWVIDKMDQNNEVVIVKKYLAKELECSRNTLESMINKMIDDRLMVWIGKNQHNNVYLFNPSMMWKGPHNKQEQAMIKFNQMFSTQPAPIQESQKNIQKKTKRVTAVKSSIDPQIIVDLYNSMLTPGLPKVIKITEQRIKKIAKLCEKDLPVIESWNHFFLLVSESDFLMGKSSSWQCSFDWLMKPANALKVAEGNYKNTQFSKNRQEDESRKVKLDWDSADF